MPDARSLGDGPVYFVSDAHLGVDIGPPDREERLIALLQRIPGSASALFLLGDLFDFWFEYRHAIPKGTFRVARAIGTVVEAGIPVTYLGGNHDFWVGTYLQQELGVEVHQEPISVRLHGRLVHLAHGDGLGPGDTGYKILKRVLRHPLAIAAYRCIHPDLGIPLAHRISAVSRRHTEAREILLPKILRDVAGPTVRGETTAMIMGHVHEPCHYRGNGRDFLILGDWIDNFTFARMDDGVLRLIRLDGEKEIEIPADVWPELPLPGDEKR